MNKQEYLFTQAASECSEVAHRISKILAFGINEKQTADAKDNAERLIGEYADLVAVMEMLEDRGYFKIFEAEFTRMKATKKERVIHYSKYAQVLGTLTEPL